MNAWHSRRHAAVAFVGDQHYGASLGYCEVHAGYRHVSASEHGSQLLTGAPSQALCVLAAQILAVVRQQICNLFSSLVHRRRDDVVRRLMGELNDVLPQVSFHYLQAVRLQDVV